MNFRDFAGYTENVTNKVVGDWKNQCVNLYKINFAEILLGKLLYLTLREVIDSITRIGTVQKMNITFKHTCDSKEKPTHL